MGVPALVWGDSAPAARARLVKEADIIIDGIAGTGLEGPLRDQAAEMAAALNALRVERGEPHHRSLPVTPLIVSIDIPSGISDHWQPGMPVVQADAVFAIEPRKLCLYRPAARPYSGTILPVGGVFPPQLAAQFQTAELLDWETARGRIPAVAPASYKHERGVVEIRAGSTDAPGAARIAARGAQAAGAGLIRLIVDTAIHPILAANAGGIMVAAISAADNVTGGEGAAPPRFSPDAIVLGPGWGKGEDRALMLRNALEKEAAGIPLILDADAIVLAKNCVFHGNTLLTPHPG
jgi:NAD(P)H-hydrate epimerase